MQKTLSVVHSLISFPQICRAMCPSNRHSSDDDILFFLLQINANAIFDQTGRDD